MYVLLPTFITGRKEELLLAIYLVYYSGGDVELRWLCWLLATFKPGSSP